MIKRSDILWVPTKYLRIPGTQQHEFELDLYRPLADWDVFDEWERVRTRHMQKTLTRADILFDIGAESGWQSVIYGQIVGPSNLVLVEPSPSFWPNIEALWHRNFDAEPLACYQGLFSWQTTDLKIEQGWPQASKGDLSETNDYAYIHENKELPQIKLDDYVKQTGIVPNAITVDVEGAELLVLRGAEETLRRKDIKLWVSVHPDLAERNYGYKHDDLFGFIKELGYRKEHLGTDHEEHWYYAR